jgi:crossover junction endodeoxyribonuclease RuvC
LPGCQQAGYTWGMKILAIDPGYERLGIAVIEKDGKSKESLVFSECFKTLSKDPHPIRLGHIHDHIEKLIKKFKPSHLSIETLFFMNNQKTVMQVSEARGAIISLCAAERIEVKEFTPLQIKVAVTGNGRSDKQQMIKMVPLLIKIDKNIKHDDEYDAIACGLAYFAHYPQR